MVIINEPEEGLDINTIIATPSGWITIGGLKIGDIIFSDDGTLCNVIATSEIMNNHDCYEIEFSDGSKIIADKNHLWETYTHDIRIKSKLYTVERRNQRREKSRKENKEKNINFKEKEWLYREPLPIPKPIILTTEKICESLYSKFKILNHAVKFIKPLNLETKSLAIDPYVLGAWLGDGHSNGDGMTNDDFEILEHFIHVGYIVKKRKAKFSYGISKLRKELRLNNLLKNKHIPEEYLRASFDQRLSLLQGLMDTDGTVRKGNGSCQFTTTSIKIRDGILELLRSIGVPAKYSEGNAKLYGRITSKKYNIDFLTEYPAFRLSRKLNIQKRENFRFSYRFIKNVKKIESVPVRCIQVNSLSNMFLCGKEMIPTYNSMLI